MVVHGSWNGVSGCKGLGDLALSVSLYGKEDGLSILRYFHISSVMCRIEIK